MLHILWLILKFILIVLGSIFGLIFLTLLLVLFCPFRYEAHVAKETESFKEIQGGAAVSWLWYLIYVKVWYQNGQLGKSIRLFGIPVLEVLSRLKNRKNKEKDLQQDLSQEETGQELTAIQMQVSDTESGEHPEEKAEKTEEPQETEKTEEIREDDTLAVQQDIEAMPSEVETKTPEVEPETIIQEDTVKEIEEVSPRDKEKTKPKEKTEKIAKKKKASKEAATSGPENTKKKNKIQGILEKIKQIPKKVSTAMQNAEETKQRLTAKVTWWKDFLGHERMKAFMRLLKRSLVRMVKHILPTRISGNITFGNEDPALMGKILAILGITIPFHKNTIHVTPVFDGTNVFTGNLKMKGRIRIIVFVATGIRVAIDRNLWFVIRRWKRRRNK